MVIEMLFHLKAGQQMQIALALVVIIGLSACDSRRACCPLWKMAFRIRRRS